MTLIWEPRGEVLRQSAEAGDGRQVESSLSISNIDSEIWLKTYGTLQAKLALDKNHEMIPINSSITLLISDENLDRKLSWDVIYGELFQVSKCGGSWM